MNDRFLKACRREPVDRTPVWFMRQAGRYMPEYREIRSRHSLLDICRSPELATTVTMQPVRRIDVDAAILFSDLLLPLEPMGIPFDFVRGEGPGDRKSAAHRSRHRSAEVVRAARGARARARSDPHDSARARRPAQRAAHRIRRRAVHARVVRDRRRPLAELRADQSADVLEPAGVAPAVRHARHDHGRIHEGADRSGRAGRCRFSIRGPAR